MKKEKYIPPMMGVSVVDLQEELLGVSFTYIENVESGVNALGHDVGGEYDFTLKNNADGTQTGTSTDGNDSWTITWN